MHNGNVENMNQDTGEIREIEKIPEGVDKIKWSEPFHVGEIVQLKGIQMKIVRIKKLRGEIVLQANKK